MLYNTEEYNKNKIYYDKNIKNIFSYKEILSFLIKNTIKDIGEKLTKEEIFNRLGKESIEDADNNSLKLSGINSESNKNNNVEFIYDFLTTIPLDDGTVNVFMINLEFQNKRYPGYILEHRALTYISRIINDNTNSYNNSIQAYKNIRGVYQIWILPTENKDYINRYYIVKEDDNGEITRNHKMNLIESVFIYVNKNAKITDSPLFTTLHSLLNSNFKINERFDIMNQNLDIDKICVEDFKQDFSFAEYMLSSAHNDGIKIGIEQGIEQGFYKSLAPKVEKLISLGISDIDDVCDRLFVDSDYERSIIAYILNKKE